MHARTSLNRDTATHDERTKPGLRSNTIGPRLQTGTLTALLLACLLHDIGTAEANITATGLSFEFFDGVLALRVLQNVMATGTKTKTRTRLMYVPMFVGGEPIPAPAR